MLLFAKATWCHPRQIEERHGFYGVFLRWE